MTRSVIMIRTLIFIVCVISLLLLTACSYRYDFVVINKSDKPIEVRYQLKRWTPETPGKFVDVNPPSKLTLKEFESSEHEWHELAKGQYGFDTRTGVFTVNIAPDEVLLVDFTYNYQGHEDEFDLANIRITGAYGSIDLQGREAQTAFTYESDRNYVLRYK
jgi:hypothetical protein